MKKMIYFLLFSCVLLVSCSENETIPDGGLETKWAKVSYPSKKFDGIRWYVVPKEGGEYTFLCLDQKINDGPWSLASRFGSDPEIYQENNFFDACVKDNAVHVKIAPNDTVERFAYVRLCQGFVTGGEFFFVQEGVK